MKAGTIVADHYDGTARGTVTGPVEGIPDEVEVAWSKGHDTCEQPCDLAGTTTYEAVTDLTEVV